MRIQSDTQTVIYRDWALKARPATTRPVRLLLMIHGWTGDENSMWVFARGLPTTYWIVAPQAPHKALPSGYSWRLPDTSMGDRASLVDFRTSVEALLSLVDGLLMEYKIETREFGVVGFSQGAVVAITMAFLHPDRINRVGVLSGFVPADAEPLVARHVLSGKPFFVAHGTRDETVRIEDALQSVQLLKEAGAQVTFCEDEVGHKVGARCLRALEAFFG